jgi:hypothetical protein
VKYEVTFDRISRRHDVPPLITEADDPDELATQIWDYARPLCALQDISVSVDLEKGVGAVFAGVQIAGNFRVTEIREEKPEGVR